MGLNKAMVIGHLGGAVDLRYIPTTGTPVAQFSVASNESFTDKMGTKQERAEWHDVVVFGKVAEVCSKYLQKGREVYVEGKLRTRNWEKDGLKHYRTEIVAMTVQFLGARPEGVPAGGVESEARDFDEDIPF